MTLKTEVIEKDVAVFMAVLNRERDGKNPSYTISQIHKLANLIQSLQIELYMIKHNHRKNSVVDSVDNNG